MKEIAEAIKKANYVYIIGNGGSASTANHFANDLMKMCGVRAISLCANEAIVMAYANDNGYENIFTEQLKVLHNDLEASLLITISGSGKSPNIVNAIKWAKQEAVIPVVSFPTMKELKCDMQDAETFHLEIVHQIAKELEK